MLRSDLFALAKDAGWRANRALTPAVRARIDALLRTALTADPRAIQIAPGVASDSGMRPMTLDDAVGLLMEEFR